MTTELRTRVRGLRHVKITSASSQVLIEEPVDFRGSFKLNGRGVAVGAFSYIVSARCRAETVIGRYCSIAWDVVLGDPNHPVTWLSSSPTFYGTDKFGCTFAGLVRSISATCRSAAGTTGANRRASPLPTATIA